MIDVVKLATKVQKMDSTQLERQLLFTSPTNKEDLHLWIHEYLGIDLPNSRVDPLSTSSPMDFVWEVFEAAKKNDPEYVKGIFYSSRAGYKTLSASILEVLCLVHLGRVVGHMAAISSQAAVAQGYVKTFFSRGILRDFVIGDSVREKRIIYYKSPEGHILTEKEYSKLKDVSFSPFTAYIKVVVCTVSGANSFHANFMCIDEIDVIDNPRAYEEAKGIPDVMEGKLPISVLISTRKLAFGKMSEEIEAALADESGRSRVSHWNMLDVTQRCEPERHKPDEPRVHLFWEEDEGRVWTPEEAEALPEHRRSKLQEDKEAYAGCKTCVAGPFCRGALSRQVDTTGRELYKPIENLIGKIDDWNLDMVLSQIMCRKPTVQGLVYGRLDHTSILTPSQIAQQISGFPVNIKDKEALVTWLVERQDVHWYGGVDFGFTHPFVFTLVARHHDRSFVIDVQALSDMETEEQVAYLKGVGPGLVLAKRPVVVFADPENPSGAKTLRKAGYTVKKWKKGAGSVKAGIEIVRSAIRSGAGRQRLFFLAGDLGVAWLYKALSTYRFRTTVTGEFSEEPDETGDDGPDSLRYVIMNLDKGIHSPGARGQDLTQEAKATEIKQIQNKVQRQDWLGILQVAAPEAPVAPRALKRGRLSFTR